MLKLVHFAMVCLVLATLSHVFSRRTLGSPEGYIEKDKFFWGLLIIVMISFAGLRIHYNDTDAYVHAYNLLSESNPELSDINWILGGNPGFTFLNIIIIKLGFSSQTFLMVYSIITVSIYLWFIRKYSCNLWFSIFLFIIVGNYIFTLAAIKQCIAIAFCLIGADRALQKKWIPFVLFVLLGALFHPYALLYLLTPFLIFCPWSQRTYVLLAVSALTGVLLQLLIGSIVSITAMIGEEYDVSTFLGEGVNPLRVAVIAVPTALSFIARKQIASTQSKKWYLFVNFTMLNFAIMFIGLFGTANYFARLANYFVIFQCVTLPWLFMHFEERSKRFLTITSIICYLLYFYYENGVLLPFDDYYYATTWIEFFRQLF